MENIVFTFLSGGIIGLLFLKLKLPGSVLTGAVCGTVMLSLAFRCAEMPYFAKFLAQVTAGAFIGCSVSRKDLVELKYIYRPFLVVIFSFLILNIFLGIALYSTTRLDPLTSLLCTIPGGMSDLPLTASDMGANVTQVVVLQFVRLCVGLGFFPMWIVWLDKRGSSSSGFAETPAADCRKAGEPGLTSVKSVAAAFTTALICGTVGRMSGLPAGTLVFAMLGTLFLKLSGIPVALPKWFKRLAQLLSGTYIGASVSYEALTDVPQLIVPAFVIILAYMLNAYIVGNILTRSFAIPFKEAMLMMTPAGASDMALISADIGVHSPSLVVMQIFRMLLASSVFPQISYQIAKLI